MSKKSTRILLLFAAFALFIVPVVAFAAAGFDDVDDDNVFVADIQWMKDNGITKGCNPPTNTNFCPDKAVTRQQMSAFMHRIAVNKVVDAATAVNADKLDGKDSTAFLGKTDKAADSDKLDGKDSTAFLGTTDKAADSDKLDGMHAADLAPVAVAQVDETLQGTTVTDPTTINTVDITVPSNGLLVISGSAFIVANTDGLYAIETYVGGNEIGIVSAADDFTTGDDDLDAVEWLSYTTAAAVAPGTYVVSQKVGKMDASTGDLITGALFYNGNTMTVTFVPGGTVSAATVGATSGATFNGE